MSKLADKFVHPTVFTGDWPDWHGYTWLDWVASSNCYHPADDYNRGSGNDDLGQDVKSMANGVVFHTSEKTTGYGKIIIIKHSLGYNMKKFIKDTYGIETNALYSLYAHLKDILVAVGNEVACGQLIAHVGRSGTTLAHLHNELYSLDGELQNLPYRFYPVGWTKERIKENWLPPYLFVEAVKNIESYETFLGKPKAYWETVEKDRNDLLEQLGKKDDEWLALMKPLNTEIVKLTNEIKQLKEDIAKMGETAEKVELSHQTALTKKDAIITTRERSISKLQNKLTLCIEGQAENYEPRELFTLFIKSLFKGGEINNGKSK